MVTVSTEQWKNQPPSSPPWELSIEKCFLWEEYAVRPGMRLAVQNLHPLNEPVSYRFMIEETCPVSFMCYLSGRISITMTDRNGVRRRIEYRAGDCTLCHLPGSHGESSTHPETSTQSAGLLVTPDFLWKAAKDRGLPGGRSLFTSEGGVSWFLRKENMPPQVGMTVREILHCSFEGAMRQVFMEYKAMELLLSLMALLDEQNVLRSGVTAVEQSAALQARNIMLEFMAEPPSLKELARQVGMTHPRLSAVFQLLFGDTVFGFLREQRLERARRLLEKPRQGIAETAYDCGFSSPSHFTRAFTERYGRPPSRYHAECMQRFFRNGPAED